MDRLQSDTQSINFILETEEKQILDLADAMPHEKYGFKLAAGEFNGVLSFADQLKHVAARNYLLGAGILGEKAPGHTKPGQKARAKYRSSQRSSPISKTRLSICIAPQGGFRAGGKSSFAAA